MNLFKPAVKEEAKLRLAIAGPSGSGKTYSALAIATGLSSKIALVDTEHGSASKYADLFTFDTLNMEPPFHPDRFIQAIAAAEQAGYGVIILDSLTHAWQGTGGVLDIVDEASKRIKGNTYMAWKEGTPVQNRLIDAIVQSSIHIIATMRSKTEYVVETNQNGKQAPRKVGTAPVQRDGFEYEFDVMLDMDIDNNAIVGKTRCPALAGKVIAKPGKQLADVLASWLSGAPAQPKPAAHPVPVLTGEQIQREMEERGMQGESDMDDFLHLCRQLHADPQGRPASEKMYGYVCGLVDEIAGWKGAHRPIFLDMCGRPVSIDNPMSHILGGHLIDWLAQTKKDSITKEIVPNPKYDATIAGYIYTLSVAYAPVPSGK